jgi:hypothetical protein
MLILLLVYFTTICSPMILLKIYLSFRDHRDCISSDDMAARRLSFIFLNIHYGHKALYRLSTGDILNVTSFPLLSKKH